MMPAALAHSEGIGRLVGGRAGSRRGAGAAAAAAEGLELGDELVDGADEGHDAVVEARGDSGVRLGRLGAAGGRDVGAAGTEGTLLVVEFGFGGLEGAVAAEGVEVVRGIVEVVRDPGEAIRRGGDGGRVLDALDLAREDAEAEVGVDDGDADGDGGEDESDRDLGGRLPLEVGQDEVGDGGDEAGDEKGVDEVDEAELLHLAE
mmetsp:Transcript_9880/g.31741  ORF Transcript_9880/g.31741 Transcript_9880/m.31741 type:complete len:204 (-) Transcript_9880:64-675(-)